MRWFGLWLVPLALVLMSISPVASHAVEIIAHRGASHDAPENTVAALRLGFEQGADAGELDIRLTRDGKIVVIHDADAKRTAGVQWPVADKTLDELRTLDAGRWKGAAWTGEKLPTLDEALATVPEGRRMFVEIKCGEEVLPALAGTFQRSGKRPEQLVLIGFKHATMAAARKLFPRHPIYWISGYDQDKKTGRRPDIDVLVERAKAAGFDGLDLSQDFPIDATFTARVKAAGLRLYVWTVDDPAIAARLVEAGVDGITTNRPAWLRQQLGERGRK